MSQENRRSEHVAGGAAGNNNRRCYSGGGAHDVARAALDAQLEQLLEALDVAAVGGPVSWGPGFLREEGGGARKKERKKVIAGLAGCWS